MRPLVLVVLLGFATARAEDSPARFVALLNPAGLTVRGPTAEVPGVAGYSPSVMFGVQLSSVRFGLFGALHVASPRPAPTFALGLQVSVDVMDLDLDPAHAAVFVGFQTVSRLGLPLGAQWVSLARVGVRVAGVELAFGAGPEVPIGWREVSAVTWNVEALSIAFNVPELVRVFSQLEPGFHGVRP